MIRLPDEVTEKQVAEAVAAVVAKKRLPAAGELRLERLAEGTAAQILHIGPYAAEGPTIDSLHAFIGRRD